MRTRISLLVIVCALAVWMPRPRASTHPIQAAAAGCAGVNVLTAAEKSAGWRLLFDGTSTAGWHGYNKKDTSAWVIEDCALKTVGTEGNYGSDKRGDLVTDEEFTNFELTFDWKASTGANSGVMYGVVEDPKYDAPWKTGPEYQLMDDVGFRSKLEPARSAASNYSMHAPDPAQKTLASVGEWNSTRIVVNGAHVEHWLNGKKVLAFERWTPEWNALRDAGKWKDAPDYGKAKTGRIVFQDHGSLFWFRNIKIRQVGNPKGSPSA